MNEPTRIPKYVKDKIRQAKQEICTHPLLFLSITTMVKF